MGSEMCIRDRDKAESDLEFATLMQHSVGAANEKLEKAYREAAAAEKARSEKHHGEMLAAERESRGVQEQQLEQVKQLPGLMKGILAAMPDSSKSQVSGVGYFARV